MVLRHRDGVDGVAVEDGVVGDTADRRPCRGDLIPSWRDAEGVGGGVGRRRALQRGAVEAWIGGGDPGSGCCESAGAGVVDDLGGKVGIRVLAESQESIRSDWVDKGGIGRVEIGVGVQAVEVLADPEGPFRSRGEGMAFPKGDHSQRPGEEIVVIAVEASLAIWGDGNVVTSM